MGSVVLPLAKVPILVAKVPILVAKVRNRGVANALNVVFVFFVHTWY